MTRDPSYTLLILLAGEAVVMSTYFFLSARTLHVMRNSMEVIHTVNERIYVFHDFQFSHIYLSYLNEAFQLEKSRILIFILKWLRKWSRKVSFRSHTHKIFQRETASSCVKVRNSRVGAYQPLPSHSRQRHPLP